MEVHESISVMSNDWKSPHSCRRFFQYLDPILGVPYAYFVSWLTKVNIFEISIELVDSADINEHVDVVLMYCRSRQQM